MAWYHVGACSCPVGCCDCGEPRAPESVYVYQNELGEMFTSKWARPMAYFYKKYGNEYVEEFPKGKWFQFLGKL